MKAHDCTDLIDQLAEQLAAYIQKQSAPDNVCVIGIHTGGAWLARLLVAKLKALCGVDLDLGALNIGFYRDDFTQIGLHPNVAPSDIHFDLNARQVILVDDVLYTGRTIRAALNEIFDYGRPAEVRLAVLIARDGRQLPIAPDFCAQTLQLSASQYLQLSGPQPICYEIKS